MAVHSSYYSAVGNSAVDCQTLVAADYSLVAVHNYVVVVVVDYSLVDFQTLVAVHNSAVVAVAAALVAVVDTSHSSTSHLCW